jgi:hypothetical protein
MQQITELFLLKKVQQQGIDLISVSPVDGVRPAGNDNQPEC